MEPCHGQGIWVSPPFTRTTMSLGGFQPVKPELSKNEPNDCTMIILYYCMYVGC